MTSNSWSSCLDHDQLLSDFEITSPFCMCFPSPFPSIKSVPSAWFFRTLILIYRVIAQLQNRKWSQLRLLNYVAAILTFGNSKETSVDPVTDWPARTCWCRRLLKEILNSHQRWWRCQCYSPLEFHPLAPDVQIFLITKKGRSLSCLNPPLQPRKYKTRILACSSWSVPWASCQRLLFSTLASSPRSLCPCFWLSMLASRWLCFGGSNHGIEGALNAY